MNADKKARLSAVRQKISAACKQAGRKENEITLIAVSKTKPWEDLAAFTALGVKDFGENYVQEAQEKQNRAKASGLTQIRWHLIGTLQSNKAKFIPGNFTLFHALDSPSLATKLDKAAASVGVVQDCLLEVNVDLETSKGGIADAHLTQILTQLSSLKNFRLKGLMGIPAPNPARGARAPFAKLRELRDQVNAQGAYREKLTELSMGMSGDFEAAILEGATFVRVGTILFGARETK